MHVLTLLHTNTARLAALLTALDPAALVFGTPAAGAGWVFAVQLASELPSMHLCMR
jgi:hypothetical protein